MKRCICINVPKNTDFILNEEYLYDYIIDGVKVYLKEKCIILDEITFYLHFKKTIN